MSWRSLLDLGVSRARGSDTEGSLGCGMLHRSEGEASETPRVRKLHEVKWEGVSGTLGMEVRGVSLVLGDGGGGLCWMG